MLTTSPNGAIPVGFRRKIAGDADPSAKAAAGVLHVAPDGDVLLLRRSNNEANYAGHWALPGGGVDPGESPAEGAARECREEMGVDVDPASMRPLDRRATPTGSVFHTFARPVAEKFVPKLNDEHSGYAWAPFNQLPRPLHPAVEQTLREQVGMADDMAPEEWDALRDGFLKWTAEEEDEPEHAQDELAPTDWQTCLALDRDSVREMDDAGRMKVTTANISKATVNPYRGEEIPNAKALGLDPGKVYHLLRDPEELEKAAPTFDGVQILRKHVPVSADDHQPWDVVGSVIGPTTFESPYLKSGLKFWERGAIDDIVGDSKRELSCSYRYRADMTPGIFNGMRYDGVMRDIRGNHVALVKDGRAGPDVVVGDSLENLQMKTTRFAARTLMLTAGAIAPLMAMDQKITLPKSLFTELTPKNFGEKRPALIGALKDACKGKLANDESLGEVVELLEMLDGTKRQGADEPASAEQVAGMEKAAEVAPAVAPAVSEYSKDAAGLGAFLKTKGMDEASIKTACDMFPKGATDADPDDEEKKKKELEAAKAKSKEAEDASKAKDEEMKGMVKKPAMDEAIKQARDNERGIRLALDKVRPWTGDLPIATTMAFDSADDVYRHAATMLGIKDAKTIHASALPSLIELVQRPGARPVDRSDRLAMDEASRTEAAKIAPGLERIQVGA